jgi:hypothetical protein
MGALAPPLVAVIEDNEVAPTSVESQFLTEEPHMCVADAVASLYYGAGGPLL